MEASRLLCLWGQLWRYQQETHFSHHHLSPVDVYPTGAVDIWGPLRTCNMEKPPRVEEMSNNNAHSVQEIRCWCTLQTLSVRTFQDLKREVNDSQVVQVSHLGSCLGAAREVWLPCSAPRKLPFHSSDSFFA